MNIFKPARTLSQVTPELYEALNKGLRPTRNLIEWLAIDPICFLIHLLDLSDRKYYLKNEIPKNLKKNALHQWISQELFYQIQENHDWEFLNVLSNHISDVARSWAAFIIGFQYKKDLKNLLKNIKKFADDEHFWVRESAWMAARKPLSQNLELSIQLLETWVREDNPNIRRFAIEVLRPCGVWCFHIEKLKNQPEIALPLLESLKNEKNRYVQNSVANWLNDASKSKPEFVIELCNKWKNEENTSTNYIIKRALRTINKKIINL